MDLRSSLVRTSCGIQYADLSSFTWHVEQLELRKESNVESKPMPDTGNQIDFE